MSESDLIKKLHSMPEPAGPGTPDRSSLRAIGSIMSKREYRAGQTLTAEELAELFNVRETGSLKALLRQAQNIGIVWEKNPDGTYSLTAFDEKKFAQPEKVRNYPIEKMRKIALELAQQNDVINQHGQFTIKQVRKLPSVSGLVPATVINYLIRYNLCKQLPINTKPIIYQLTQLNQAINDH